MTRGERAAFAILLTLIFDLLVGECLLHVIVVRNGHAARMAQGMMWLVGGTLLLVVAMIVRKARRVRERFRSGLMRSVE